MPGLGVRHLETELLDVLPPEDVRARRSRRELRLVNRLMGHPYILRRALRNAALQLRRTPRRIVELGAGDGTLLLSVARKLTRQWRQVEVVLVDRQAVVASETLGTFTTLGWHARTLTTDLLGAEAPRIVPDADVVLTNLVLHHFEDAALQTMLGWIAEGCDAFIAAEPRRSWAGIIASHALLLLGCSSVSRHDAKASVRAGFTGNALSRLWPQGSGWQLQERPAGLFTHLFIARRIPAAPPTMAGGDV